MPANRLILGDNLEILKSMESDSIAVKVVDNDGLEDIEVLRLEVNGAVEILT